MITINNRDKIEWENNLTVRKLLDKMGYSYSLITVTINEKLINHDDYNDTLVPDEANVIVFHLAHGG
ncbi:MAG: sulfur carrier protein ThiS [Candidatus Cloacimonetes bacterium]|nr:sulfur carrier protein ThiS [Candidatus Cloacimonadota bacterium]